MLKRTFIALGLLGAMNAWAGPSSNVAWDLDTRNMIKSGSAERGQQLAAACVSCHGSEGISPSPIYPNVAGQRADYLYKQLKDFRDRSASQSTIMSALTAGLDDQGIADLAAYYASLTPAPAKGEAELPLLVARGDGKRLIPACGICHGRKGQGKGMGIAALTGQKSQYLATTLRDYQSGKRANDVYKVMRAIAAELTDAEITELANFYGQ